MTTLTASRRMPLRAAAICGLLALVTVTVAYIWGALAQPDAYSSADDASSDLGALTANKAWIFNQIGSNLTGILIILFGLGLWRALSPDVLGRIGAGAVMLMVLGYSSQVSSRLTAAGSTRLHERFVALLGAQVGQSLFERGGIRSAAHPGVRLPPAPAVARPVASDAPRPARLGGRGRPLQRDRRRGGATRWKHHLGPLDRAPSLAADAPRGRENGQTDCGSDLNAVLTMRRSFEGAVFLDALVNTS